MLGYIWRKAIITTTALYNAEYTFSNSCQDAPNQRRSCHYVTLNATNVTLNKEVQVHTGKH